MAGITVACAAVLVLLTLPDAPAPRHGRPGQPPRIAGPPPRVARPAPAPGAPRGAPPPAPAGDPRALALPASPPVPSEKRVGLATYPVEQTWDAEVAKAQDILERLKIVDRVVNTAEIGDSLAFIDRLFDKPPGGNPEDVRAFRVGIVTRLGLLKTQPRAVARLVAELDPQVARPERLAALDALVRGGLPAPARAAVEKLATDSDEELRGKARVALRATGG